MVIGGMALPSALPPPPHPLEADVLQAHSVLQNGYVAAQAVVNLGCPDIHQVNYHRERVQSELVPLLDAISASTSDSAMVSWCFATATSFADLYNCLTQRGTFARYELDSRTVAVYLTNLLTVKDRPSFLFTQ